MAIRPPRAFQRMRRPAGSLSLSLSLRPIQPTTAEPCGQRPASPTYLARRRRRAGLALAPSSARGSAGPPEMPFRGAGWAGRRWAKRGGRIVSGERRSSARGGPGVRRSVRRGRGRARGWMERRRKIRTNFILMSGRGAVHGGRAGFTNASDEAAADRSSAVLTSARVAMVSASGREVGAECEVGGWWARRHGTVTPYHRTRQETPN